MGIREDLLRGIYGYGFEKPSAIQKRALMPIIFGRNVIAQAQSGIDKTEVVIFYAMGIREDLLRGIYGYSFEKPSAIQQRASIPIIFGRNVIAQAQSGIDKTEVVM
ncbi:hypothetical protein ZWY2020_038563 [Hordeum vulgare]|nr:hypothetical protein ZWY2020_038563 [Hordeum vulgare]